MIFSMQKISEQKNEYVFAKPLFRLLSYLVRSEQLSSCTPARNPVHGCFASLSMTKALSLRAHARNPLRGRFTMPRLIQQDKLPHAYICVG